MLRSERDTLGHLGYCLDEMLAEIDDQLGRLEAVRALAQLDEREARGDTVQAVCGKCLRATLEQQVAGHRLSLARAKIVAAQAILAPTSELSGAVAAAETPTAVPPAAPKSSDAGSATVTDLAAYRAAKSAPRGGRAVARAARVMLAAGLLALGGLGGLGSAGYVSHALRLPGFEISVSAMPTPAVTAPAGLAASY